MFNELPLSGPERRPTRTRWTFLLSLGGELTVLAVLLLIPLVYVQGPPFTWHETTIALPSAPTAPPTVAHAATATPPRGATVFTIPAFIPPHATVVRDSFKNANAPGAGSTAIPGAIPGIGNNGRWTQILPKTGPTRPAAAPSAPSRIRLGGDVEAAKLIRMVRPFYPPIARQAGVEGTVVLSATIATDGTVEALHYVSGPALLVQAAMNAVRQWRYEPTLLNGGPVAVETTIKVIFVLGDSGGGGPQGAGAANTAKAR
jgi:protein TonB